MAVTADRVIVELEAKLDRYEANVRKAESRFNSATREITQSSRRMEREIQRSTGAVGQQFRNMAGAIAAAFSVRQIAQLADSYTRFTNQLGVAGLEGTRLVRVQEQLFETAQRYGVELESLGTLYSRGAQVAGELGATQAELLQFTNGVAAALKVQGSSATEARGALMQLSQALGSGTVRAEEFNSINEGALPILKAVAQNLDGAGGSVARLKALVNDQAVSSDAFFRAFLKGTADLEEQAESAALTIGNSFTVLNNALGLYIGQADDSLSATERLSSAIIALSENLDSVVKAIALIGTVMVGRYAAGMIAGGVATRALVAHLSIATTSLAGTALAARSAGAALLTALGGPVGLAVTGLALGIYYLATQTDKAAEASEDYQAQLDASRVAKEKAADAADELANATGRAREQSLANAKALREETVQLLENAKAAAANARIKLQATVAENRDLLRQASRTVRGAGGGVDPIITQSRVNANRERQARTDIMAAEVAAAGFASTIAELDQAIKATPLVRNTPAGKPDKVKKGPKGPKPVDLDEVARRFEDDIARGELEIAQALADVVGTAEARRDVERQRIRVEQESTARAIKADDDLNEAQRGRLLAINDELAAARLAAIAAEAHAEAIEETTMLRAETVRNEQDILRAQAGLAETAKERRAIELRILDLQIEEERIRAQAIVDNTQLAAAEREAARRRLAALDEIHEGEREGVIRDTEGPWARRRREMDRSPEEIAELAEQWMVDELDSIQDRLHKAITDKLGVKDPILGGILDLFIEQVIMKPIAAAFEGAASTQGGFFGALLGGITSLVSGGRASGGHVVGGRIYPVNEGGKVEGFQPAGSGKIIPLGPMRGAGGGGVTINQTVKVDASGSVNPEGFAEHIVSRVRQETVAIVGQGMKRVTQGVPARLAQFQQDGT